MKTIWIVGIAMIFFIFGIFVGYVYGYQAGARDVVEYASELVDKMKVDTFNIEVNGQKIGDIIDKLQNMTDRVNDQLNNISPVK
jgi:proteasome assembly chaperone (PAC2) family protein